MALTIEHFQDFDVYRNELKKTLEKLLASKYSLIKITISNKEHEVVVCGKNHDELMKVLLKIDSVSLLGSGKYETGTFYPVSKKPIKEKHLVDLKINKITSVHSEDAYDLNDEIPDFPEMTFGGYFNYVKERKEQIDFITCKGLQDEMRKELAKAGEVLLAFGQSDYSGAKGSINKMKEILETEEEYKPVKKELLNWLKIAVDNKMKELAEELADINKVLDTGKVLSARKKMATSLDKLKSTPDFNPEAGAKAEGKMKEIRSQRNFADSYTTVKQRVNDSVKVYISDPKKNKNMFKGATVVAKEFPKIMSDDLRKKLEAVDKSADKTMKERRPFIEAALLVVRKYIKELQLLSRKIDKFNEEFQEKEFKRQDEELDYLADTSRVELAQFVFPMLEMLRIIHEDLSNLYNE